MKEKYISQFFSAQQTMTNPDFDLYYYKDIGLKTVNEHLHTNNYELLFLLEGHASYQVEGESYTLQPNNIAIIKPNTKHSMTLLSENTPYRRFVLWIHEDLLANLVSFNEDFNYIFKREEPFSIYKVDTVEFLRVQSKIIRLLEDISSDQYGKELQRRLDFADILLDLNRVAYNLLEKKSLKQEASLYQNILAYIRDHLEEPISLDMLADKFYVSKYYVAHLFKTNMGISLYQYVLKKRVEAAKTMILTGVSITKASELVGFGSYSNFYRAFIREYNISPKDFLDQHQLSSS